MRPKGKWTITKNRLAPRRCNLLTPHMHFSSIDKRYILPRICTPEPPRMWRVLYIFLEGVSASSVINAALGLFTRGLQRSRTHSASHFRVAFRSYPCFANSVCRFTHKGMLPSLASQPAFADSHVSRYREGAAPAHFCRLWNVQTTNPAASSSANPLPMSFRVTPQPSSCLCVLIRFPFSLPAWLMCSSKSRSKIRRAVIPRDWYKRLPFMLRGIQNHGSLSGGPDPRPRPGFAFFDDIGSLFALLARSDIFVIGMEIGSTDEQRKTAW
jgi:hypothetical protein